MPSANFLTQVILSLREALRAAGVKEEELEACLAPVDLAAAGHQKYARAAE